MKLSEIITRGKISKEGIEYIENHLKEMEELREENAKANEAFAKKFLHYGALDGFRVPHGRNVVYFTREEFIRDVEKESIKSLTEACRELEVSNSYLATTNNNLTSTIKDLQSKISTFNALPWCKRIFKTP